MAYRKTVQDTFEAEQFDARAPTWSEHVFAQKERGRFRYFVYSQPGGTISEIESGDWIVVDKEPRAIPDAIFQQLYVGD